MPADSASVQCAQDVNDSILAIRIPEGAHHLDLFFSHPNDPRSVTAAREAQRREMRRWVKQKARRVAAARLGGRRSGSSAVL